MRRSSLGAPGCHTGIPGLALPRLWWAAAVGIAGAAALWWLWAWDPAAGAGRYVMCPFYGFTGLHCPGCGTLRALHRLLHLDLPGAWAFNPLTVLCVAALAADGPLRVVAARWRAAQLRRPAVLRATRLLPVAVGLFWILRNLPVAPFQRLAPG